VAHRHGDTVADIPLGPLADNAPKYDRPHVPTPKRAPLGELRESTDPGADLPKLIASPDLPSKRWIQDKSNNMVRAAPPRPAEVGLVAQWPTDGRGNWGPTVRAGGTRSESVITAIPGSTFREQAGTSTLEPATSTTQTLQTLTGVRFSA